MYESHTVGTSNGVRPWPFLRNRPTFLHSNLLQEFFQSTFQLNISGIIVVIVPNWLIF